VLGLDRPPTPALLVLGVHNGNDLVPARKS
jgi:hypothetical protein